MSKGLETEHHQTTPAVVIVLVWINQAWCLPRLTFHWFSWGSFFKVKLGEGNSLLVKPAIPKLEENFLPHLRTSKVSSPEVGLDGVSSRAVLNVTHLIVRDSERNINKPAEKRRINSGQRKCEIFMLSDSVKVAWRQSRINLSGSFSYLEGWQQFCKSGNTNLSLSVLQTEKLGKVSSEFLSLPVMQLWATLPLI